MAKLSKRAAAIAQKIDRTKLYPVAEALTLVKETAVAKFDESIDVAVQLGIDPKKSDQLVRGSVVLPAGTGKSVRVAVFAQGDKAEAAKPPAPTSSVWTTWPTRSRPVKWTSTWSSPRPTRCVSWVLGQILGPRGLMPNPKVGTVTPDVVTAVKNAKPVRFSTVPTRPASSTQRSAARRSAWNSCKPTWPLWSTPCKRPVPQPPRAFTCASWPFRPRWAAVRAWKSPRCRLNPDSCKRTLGRIRISPDAAVKDRWSRAVPSLAFPQGRQFPLPRLIPKLA